MNRGLTIRSATSRVSYHAPWVSIDDAYLVLALIACALVPFAAVPFILLYAMEERHSSLLFALLVGLLAASLAYGVHTTVTADIDRYTESLKVFRETSFIGVFSIEGVYSSVGSHGYNLLAWVVSKFGNDQLLRSVVVFSFYSIASYIIDDYACHHQWGIATRISSSLLCVSIVPFFNILSYAKSTPAFSILLLAVYSDFEKHSNRFTLLLLYVLSASMHSAVLPVIALRLALLVFRSVIPVYLLGGLLQPISALLSAAIPAALRNLPLISLFVYALDRFAMYSEFDGWGWAAASRDSILLNGYRYYFVAIALLYIVLRFFGKSDSKSRFLEFGGVWSALSITIALAISADVFFRYAMPAAVFFSLVSMECMKGRMKSFLVCALGLIALVGVLVQLAYLASVCDMTTFALHGMFGLEQWFE